MQNKYCQNCSGNTKQIFVESIWRCEECFNIHSEFLPHPESLLHEIKLAGSQIIQLNEEIKGLREEIELMRTTTYCAYCGVRFPLDDDAAHLVSEHIHSCEKHPMRLAEAEIKRLMNEVKESNDLLRSAWMIAKRDGKDTNWEAFRGQLSIALERQHKMMYPQEEL